MMSTDILIHIQLRLWHLSDYDKLEKDNYIVIQTTSVGLYPDCDKAIIEE